MAPKKVKQTFRKPSSGEMELLGLLWEHGPLTLSEAHEKMSRPVGYTTMQTRLNRLVDKGLATREKVGKRPTSYAASVEQDQVEAGALDQLVENVTRGRVVPLVAHLVESSELSLDELGELKKLVRDAERKLKDKEQS